MINEIKRYIEKPLLDEILEPGGKYIFAIGTLYTTPTMTTGVLPNALFVHQDSGDFSTGEWLMSKEPSSNAQNTLGLRLLFGGTCRIMPCGQITYPEP